MTNEVYEEPAVAPDAPPLPLRPWRRWSVRLTTGSAATGDLRSEIGWATGRFAPAVLLKVFAFFVLFYLVYGAGLSPAAAGLIIFIARISDIVSSPAIGVVSDGLQSRWGRRRPVMLVGGLVSALSCVLLFDVPAGLGAFRFAYFVGVMILFEVAYGLINIPHQAMALEMAPTSGERQRLLFLGVVMTIVGFLAGGVFPAIVQRFGQGARGYASAGWALAICVAASVVICVFSTAKARFVATRQGAVKWKDVGHVLRNRPFLVFISGEIVSALMVAGQASILVFVIQGVMKYPLKILALTTTVGIVTQFATLPLWALLARRIGTRRALFASISAALVYSASWLFAARGDPLWVFLGRYVLFGAMVSGNSLIGLAIKSDITEYGTLTAGVRREGLYTSVFSFAEKTAGAFGILVSGVVLEVGGFDRKLPSLADQSARAVRALYVGAAVMPTVGYVIMLLLFLRFYRLDETVLAAARRSSTL